MNPYFALKFFVVVIAGIAAAAGSLRAARKRRDRLSRINSRVGRAPTIALLDRVADGVQKALGTERPLSSVLQIL